MAYAKPPRFQTRVLNNSFGDGVNTFLSPFEIKDSELTDMRNMNGDFYPALTVRPARSSHAPNVSSPNTLGARNNQTLQVVANSSWLSYSTATGLYTSLLATTNITPKAKVIEFIKPSIRESVLATTNALYLYDGSATTQVTDVNVPKSRYITAFRDRLYALEGNVIKHSGNRKSTDWTTIDDAGSVSIANQQGTPSGIVTYNDHVLAFTDQSMHELYGTEPADYSLVDVSLEIGTVEDRSVKECRGRLFFLDYKGVYMYTGGRPQPVGDAVKHYTDNINFTHKTKICAGVLGDKYFLSLPYTTASTDPNILLEFNTKLGKWYVHDGNYIDFMTIQDELFGITTTGGVHNMESTNVQDPGNTPIDWYLVTKPFWDNSIEFRKSLHSMWLVHQISTGGAIRLQYSTNVEGTDFTDLASSTKATPDFTVDSTHHNERILVPLTNLQNVPWYRMKISGTGLGKVYYMQRNLRVKGR